MATLYTEDLFNSDRDVVTAKSRRNEYSSSGAFKSAVDSWLAERSIEHRWAGESKHSNDTEWWYLYSVHVPDEQSRTLFNLRWA